MSDKVSDRPWEIDPIEFTEGDWFIYRSETIGLYNYEIGGIRIPKTVDAEQLVTWGMARVVVYQALMPWENSISFPPSGDIMRALFDTADDPKNRKYIVPNKKKFSYVNRFWLVQDGKAEGTEQLKRDVLSAKIKDADNSDTWDTDGITLVPKEGFNVQRNVNLRGMYKVQKGPTCFNWNASRLLEEGLAVSLYESKLEALATCKNVKFETLRKDLHDFWFAEDADSLADFKQISQRWHEISTQTTSHHRDRLLEHIDQTIVEYKQPAKQAEALKQRQADWLNEIGSLKQNIAQASELAQNVNNIAQTVTLSATDKEEACYALYETAQNALSETVSFFERLQSEMAILENDVAKLKETDAPPMFPFDKLAFEPNVEALPEVKKLRIDFLLAQRMGKKDYSKGFDLTSGKNELSDLLTKSNQIKDSLQKSKQRVDDIHQRRTTLNKILTDVGDKVRSKPPLISHSWKSDNIKYTTAVKIKRGSYQGVYIVYHGATSTTVTADELVYMKLARRK